METREEQRIEIGKEKVKMKKKVCVWSIGYPQLDVTLRIYRVAWSVPFRSRNLNKSRVKIWLLTRIGRFGPVWPVSEQVWPVRPGCRSSGRHNFLIRSPNWTFYICSLIVSTRSMQWWSSIDNLKKFSWPVWLVYTTGLTGSPNLSSKPWLVPILVVNIYPPVLWQSLRAKEHSSVPKLSKGDDQ